MHKKQINNDMSVGIYSENPNAHSHAIVVFYVEWKDTKRNKLIAATTLTTIAKAIENPEHLIELATDNLREDYRLAVEAYQTVRGAIEQREMNDELGWYGEDIDMEEWLAEMEELEETE
jgi:hypothetical protein